MTSIAPLGDVDTGAKNACSSPRGPANRIASPAIAVAAGEPVAAPGLEPVATGADEDGDGSWDAGAHAASTAAAAEVDSPSNASRRNASRRVMSPSAQSSPTSPAR